MADVDLSKLLTPDQLRIVRAQQQQEMARARAQGQTGKQQVASSIGDFFGEGILAGLRSSGVLKDPEMERAQKYQAAMQVANDFTPDTEKSDFDNNRARLAHMSKALKGIDPQTDFELMKQSLVLDTEKFNRDRLTAADDRDVKKLEAELKESRLDFQIAQLGLEQAKRVAKDGKGADLAHFRLADGSTATIRPDAPEFDKLLKEPGTKFLGYESAIQAAALASQKQSAKDRKANTKPFERLEKLNMSELAASVTTMTRMMDAMGFKETADAQGNVTPSQGEGLRTGPVVEFFSRGWDALSEYAPGMEPSDLANFRAAANQFSIQAQALIKGVPSNADQILVTLAKPSPGRNPIDNARNMTMWRDLAKQSVRYHYLDALERGQEVPQAIVDSARLLGMDLSAVIGSADDVVAEQKQYMEALRPSLEAQTIKPSGATRIKE